MKKKFIGLLLVLFALSGCAKDFVNQLGAANGTVVLLTKGTRSAFDNKIITYDQKQSIAQQLVNASKFLDSAYPYRYTDLTTAKGYYSLAIPLITRADSLLTSSGGKK